MVFSEGSVCEAVNDVATGGAVPHDEVVSVPNTAVETLPSASVACAETWYEPGRSGTKTGVAPDGASVAALPAGRERSVHCQRYGCVRTPQLVLLSVSAEESTTGVPAAKMPFPGLGWMAPSTGGFEPQDPALICTVTGPDEKPPASVTTSWNW